MNKKWKIATGAVVIIAVIATPLILHHIKRTREIACFWHLAAIQSSIFSSSMSQRWAESDPVKEEIVRSYLREQDFICPSGGKYVMPESVGTGRPKCSLHGNLLDKYGYPSDELEARRNPNKLLKGIR